MWPNSLKLIGIHLINIIIYVIMSCHECCCRSNRALKSCVIKDLLKCRSLIFWQEIWRLPPNFGELVIRSRPRICQSTVLPKLPIKMEQIRNDSLTSPLPQSLRGDLSLPVYGSILRRSLSLSNAGQERERRFCFFDLKSHEIWALCVTERERWSIVNFKSDISAFHLQVTTGPIK